VQGRRGIIGVRADASSEDKTIGTINLAGSIVAIGGEVLLSRPVDDGFALVKVPNSRGVACSRTISRPDARDGEDRCSSRPAFVPVEPDRDRAGRSSG
jgi:outer membrane usher protein FimD/PapC